MKKVLFLLAFIFLIVLITYGQWSTTYLSQGTIRMGGAVLGKKAYFAGGLLAGGFDNNKVEIYDKETGQWQVDCLTQARQIISATTCGDFVFFAGGLSNWAPSSRVDIFNNYGFLWHSELSVPRFALSAVSYGDLALFAGGGGPSGSTDIVDVYNVSTHQWETPMHLSCPRTSMGSAVAGNLAFFAGGGDADNVVMSDRVDIYDFINGTWNTDTLSQARSFPGITVAQNKVIIAGGSLANGVPTGRVDIYDLITGDWSTAELSVARGFFSQSTTVCGLAYFVGSGTFDQGWTNGTDTIDVYDPATDSWSVITLPVKVTENTVVAIDSTLFSAGGFNENNPPYGIWLNTVEMFTDDICSYGVNVGTEASQSIMNHLTLYPNPCQGLINVHLEGSVDKDPLTLIFFNLNGQEVHRISVYNDDAGVKLVLPAGIYFLKVISEEQVYSQKVIVQ
jgi:hypothetical protein